MLTNTDRALEVGTSEDSIGMVDSLGGVSKAEEGKGGIEEQAHGVVGLDATSS